MIFKSSIAEIEEYISKRRNENTPIQPFILICGTPSKPKEIIVFFDCILSALYQQEFCQSNMEFYPYECDFFLSATEGMMAVDRCRTTRVQINKKRASLITEIVTTRLQQTVLSTNRCSEIEAGAVLFQRGDRPKERRIVSYASRKFSETQKRYAAVERECLAVIWATDKFRPYLETRRFELLTDNLALTWLHRTKDKNSKLTRLSLQLANLDFSTVNVPGIQNEAPDLLSRDPAPDPIIDEDRLEEKLVGAPSTPKTDIDLESDRIFYMGNIHDSDNTPLTATTLGKWQSEDAAIRDIIAGQQWDSQAAPHTRRDTKNQNTTRNLEVSRSLPVQPPGLERNVPGGSTTVLLERSKERRQEVISVDLMGPYPRSGKGKSHILEATDCFSRWIEAYPLGTATSKTIIETLEREFFSRFGYPRVCLSDNGSQFVSNEMLNALERCGIQGWTTPIYHPRANPVERRNQDLKKGLRAQLVDGKHKSWDTKLPAILFSIWNSCNE
ncbi:Integrase catalytic domain-containing protein, partial [Aphis craccivora]